MQTSKQQELAQLRTAEENDVATAVLDQHAKEQRDRGEIAELHAKHETLREYELILLLLHHAQAPVLGSHRMQHHCSVASLYDFVLVFSCL